MRAGGQRQGTSRGSTSARCNSAGARATRAPTCLALQAPRLVHQLALQGVGATRNTCAKVVTTRLPRGPVAAMVLSCCAESRPSDRTETTSRPLQHNAMRCPPGLRMGSRTACPGRQPLTWNRSCTHVRTGRLRAAAALAAAALSSCRLGDRPGPPPCPLVGLRALVGLCAREEAREEAREASREARRAADCAARSSFSSASLMSFSSQLRNSWASCGEPERCV